MKEIIHSIVFAFIFLGIYKWLRYACNLIDAKIEEYYANKPEDKK